MILWQDPPCFDYLFEDIETTKLKLKLILAELSHNSTYIFIRPFKLSFKLGVVLKFPSKTMGIHYIGLQVPNLAHSKWKLLSIRIMELLREPPKNVCLTTQKSIDRHTDFNKCCDCCDFFKEYIDETFVFYAINPRKCFSVIQPFTVSFKWGVILKFPSKTMWIHYIWLQKLARSKW